MWFTKGIHLSTTSIFVPLNYITPQGYGELFLHKQIWVQSKFYCHTQDL